MVDDALPYIVTVASTFTVAYSVRFIHDVFLGPAPAGLPRAPQEPPRWMRFPVELLVLACIVVGAIPSLTIGPYLYSAARAVLGADVPAYSLAVWHGFTPALLMSFFALVGGAALYLLLHGYLHRSPAGPPWVRELKGQRIFERVMVTISWRWARSLERILGTRRLQPQLRLLVCVAVTAALLPVYGRGLDWGEATLTELDPAFALVWAVGILFALAGAYVAKFHRLAALVLIGGAGLVTCVTFVWLSAPDLALTQLVVEIVTTVLILLGLRWLPKRIEQTGRNVSDRGRDRARRLRDITIAVVSGVCLFTLAYAVLTRPMPDSISAFFLERAYTEGGGTNVVNVILVDFRGFDTFGEITVLGVVALTVFALLRRFRPAPDSIDIPEQQHLQNAHDEAHPKRQVGDTVADYLAVPAVIMKLMFPFIGLLAVFLFLRGHDLPGGGFVAGLTVAAGLILQYMASGIRFVEAHLRVHPVRWMAVGLMLAGSAGAGPWLFSRPFLTSHSSYADIPLIGPVPLATALIFDLGVFALVLGATTLVLIALAHQSIRSERIQAPRKPIAARTEVE
jgi:multicomponent K+:H+ antiporter subunit A